MPGGSLHEQGAKSNPLVMTPAFFTGRKKHMVMHMNSSGSVATLSGRTSPLDYLFSEVKKPGG